MSVTREDWLRAVADVMPTVVDDPTAMTAQDFAEIAGCAWTTARRRLMAMVKAGTATRVSKRIQTGDGRMLRVPAFQLTKPKRGAHGLAPHQRR